MGGSGFLCSTFKVLHDFSCIVYFTCWFLIVKPALSLSLSLSVVLWEFSIKILVFGFVIWRERVSPNRQYHYLRLNVVQFQKTTVWTRSEYLKNCAVWVTCVSCSWTVLCCHKRAQYRCRREPVPLEGPDKSTLKCIRSKIESYTLSTLCPFYSMTYEIYTNNKLHLLLIPLVW